MTADAPLPAPTDLAFTRDEKFIIAGCAISMLIVQMDWFALNLAIPAIAAHFNVAATDLQWVVSGYMLAIGALMVTAGRLADIYGRRRIIVTGLVVFGVISVVCGLAPNEVFLIVARVVHGVGAALIFPVSVAVVSSTFSGPRQARATAWCWASRQSARRSDLSWAARSRSTSTGAASSSSTCRSASRPS